jgi:hypothetical protein
VVVVAAGVLHPCPVVVAAAEQQGPAEYTDGGDGGQTDGAAFSV